MRAVTRPLIAVVALLPLGALRAATPVAAASASAPAPATSVQASEAVAPPGVAPAAPTTRLGEVTVTAQRREEAINSVPIAISAFSGQALHQIGVDNTRDLGKVVPGFTVADSGFDTPTYTLRGVGFADSSFSTTSTVGVYADEVSLAYPVMTKGPNFDLRGVEVLEGPQGTLYGRNSTAGTINYIANKPSRRFTAGGEVSYGSFGRVDADGYASGSLSDSVRARIAFAGTESQQGWQVSNTRPDDRLGRLDRQAARGMLDWHLNDELFLRFTVSGWIDRSEPQAPYAVALQPQSPFAALLGSSLVLDPTIQNYPLVPNNRNPKIADWNPRAHYGLHDNFWMGSIRATWEVTDSTELTALCSYEQMRADGSELPQGGLNVEDIDEKLLAYIRTSSGELRLHGKIGESFDWLLGANANYDKHHEIDEGFASDNSLNAPLYGDTPPLFKPLLLQKGAARGDAQVHSAGVFADADWTFLRALKLTLGARYTHDGEAYAGCTLELPDNNSIVPISDLFTLASLLKGGHSVVTPGQCGSVDSHGNAGLFVSHLAETNLSYRSVLSWAPRKQALLYASYTRGFKAGGFPTIFSVDQQSLSPVVEEQLDAYEVGAKLTALGQRIHVNASMFYYDYKNKQLLTYFKDPIFGALQYLQNVPRSLDEGMEARFTAIPAERLVLTAAASYTRTKVVTFTGLTSQGAAFDFAGQSFNYTPRVQASFIANYTVQVAPCATLTPGASFVYTGGTNSTLEHDPLFAIPAHRVYDLQVGLASPGRSWTLTAYVRNVTNEFYRTSVVKLGDSVWAFTGMPRVLGINFTYDLH